MSEAIVIGAGPAGLSAGAALRRVGVDFEILEERDAVGWSWRHHYERLHLHTVKNHSALPFRPMPRDYPRFPSRQQVVDYLEEYARHFELTPTFGCSVRSITRENGHWRVEGSDSVRSAACVVVASGYNRVPNRPEFPGQAEFGGEIVHSSEYRNGKPYAQKRVLVIGCGNSGAEIALDLLEHGAQPSLVIRGPIHVIPRVLLGRASQETAIMLRHLPPRWADAITTTLLRFVVGDLRAWGIEKPKKGPVQLIVEDGRVSLLDVGTLAQIKAGKIAVVPGVSGFGPGEVRFVDDEVRPFDAVVMATGFTSGLSRLLADISVLDDKGLPRVHGEEAAPGLFFTGFRNPPTGAFREMALEAPRIAEAVRKKRG